MASATTGALRPPRASGRDALRTAGVVACAVIAVVVVSVALIAVGGHDPGQALAAWWRGSFGSSYALFSATLVRATPLVLTGLAVALAFTAGVLNIGAEGQFLAGAAAVTAFGVVGEHLVHGVALPLALGMAAVAGAGWAFIPAWLRRRFGVLEVISTIMMNFVALYFVGYLVRGPLQEPLGIYPQSAPLPEALHVPVILQGTRLHLGLPVALACAGVLWWVLRHTAVGFRIRVAGASPAAARSAGLIDVESNVARTFLVSGGLAGLAGGIEVTAVTRALYENLSPGYGYTAIAVALLAGLDPARVVVSGVFFGALGAGASAMQRDAGVPMVLATVVEALIILAVIATTGLRLRGGRRASPTVVASEPSRGGTGSTALP